MLSQLEKFIFRGKFSCLMTLALAIWGIRQLWRVECFFFTTLTMLAISINAVLNLLCRCKINCACMRCKTYKFLTHFLNYFSMTLLLMDMIQLIKDTGMMYLPFSYALIVAIHAMLSANRKCKKKNFDCLNVTACLILCIVSTTQQNIYGVLAALLAALINYVSTKPKNKRTQGCTPILDKKNYLYMMFIYCATYTIITTIERCCGWRPPCYRMLDCFQCVNVPNCHVNSYPCCTSIIDSFTSIPRIGTKMLYCFQKMMSDKICDFCSARHSPYQPCDPCEPCDPCDPCPDPCEEPPYDSCDQPLQSCAYVLR